jgi:chromate transporter
VGVFLPSTLLLLFLFPLYQNIKSNPLVYRALEGIHAAIVGIIWASGIVLWGSIQPSSILDLGVTAATFLLLQFTKIPAPVLVAACLIAGALWG